MEGEGKEDRNVALFLRGIWHAIAHVCYLLSIEVLVNPVIR